MQHFLSQNRVYIKLILVAIFFGSTFVAGRVIAQVVPPFTAAWIRFFIASLFLLLFSWQKYGPYALPDKKQLTLIILLGFSGMALYNFLFFSGLKLIPASRASIIIALNPVAVALFSRISFKEEFTVLKTFGLIVALVGAVIVISHGDPGILFTSAIGIGELLILGCVACWTCFTLLGKVVMKSIPPLLSVTYACIAGTLLLTVPAVLEGVMPQVFTYSREVWIGLLVLGVLATSLAFTWFYEGVDIIGPSRAGVFLSFVPVCASIMAVVILQEAMDIAFLIGTLLVVFGVLFTNRKVEKHLPETMWNMD